MPLSLLLPLPLPLPLLLLLLLPPLLRQLTSRRNSVSSSKPSSGDTESRPPRGGAFITTVTCVRNRVLGFRTTPGYWLLIVPVVNVPFFTLGYSIPAKSSGSA